jgi:hypothetical protein
MRNFEINILNQYWIDDDPNNVTDLCSHGELEIYINDVKIIDASDKCDWTLPTTTLSLLRSIDGVNEPKSEKILHCGEWMMLGCPIEIDWKCEYYGNSIIIPKVIKCLTTNIESSEYFYTNCTIPRPIYGKEIVKFAKNVLQFYENSLPREIDVNEFDYQFYQDGWKELLQLFEKYSTEFEPNLNK